MCQIRLTMCNSQRISAFTRTLSLWCKVEEQLSPPVSNSEAAKTRPADWCSSSTWIKRREVLSRTATISLRSPVGVSARHTRSCLLAACWNLFNPPEISPKTSPICKSANKSNRPWSSAWWLIRRRQARFNCRISLEFLKCSAYRSTILSWWNSWTSEGMS